MRYQLKQKFFSLTKQYQIADQHSQPVFQLIGKFFSIGHNLSFQTVDGNELAQIRQKLLTFMPKYEIFTTGQHFATIVKEFSWFKNKFTLDVPGPNDYTITGSFWDYEYQFERSGRIVAQVSKAFWSFTDTYGVEIDDNEDQVSILATTAVIDLCCHEKNSSSIMAD